MADQTMCPSCGARNAPGAEWCGQCFARFDLPEQTGTTSSEPSETSQPITAVLEVPESTGPEEEGDPSASFAAADDGGSPDVPQGVSQGLSQGTSQGTLFEPEPADDPASAASWECGSCGKRHPLDSEKCDVCGTTMFETYGAETDAPPAVDESTALTAALVPGYGHAKVGQPALGVPIGLLVLLAFGVGITFIFASMALVGVLLCLVAIGLWAVSVLDVARIARGDRDSVLLKPRVVSVIAVMLLLLILVALVFRSVQNPTA